MADIKVRVGQENAIKVVASVSGSAGGNAVTAKNVIGGIASVTQLYVSGITTFAGGSLGVYGNAYFNSNVSIAGSLTVGSITFPEINGGTY